MRARTGLILGLIALVGLGVGLGFLWLGTGSRGEAVETVEVSRDDPRATPAELAAPAGPPRGVELAAPVEPESDGEATAPVATPEDRGKPDPGPVLLFRHGTNDPEFQSGGHFEVRLGLTNAGWAFDNDEISAVEVPTGFQVSLFEDENGGGHRVVLGPGRHNLLPYGFNDRASSVRVARQGEEITATGPEDAVELFEHRSTGMDERGEVWRLTLPASRDEYLFTPAQDHFDDNQASMVWVPAGYECTLFDTPDGRGLALVLGPGFHELDFVSFNDKTSSARVRRHR